MRGYDEDTLVAEAQSVLGPGEQVLAAGIFGLGELRHAQKKGGLLGGLIGALAPGDLDVVAGVLAGGIIAKHEAAARAGATVQLLVAVTPDTIHVLNRDASGALDTEYASFSRATTQIDVHPMGLSRRLTLSDSAGGASIELHGAVGGLSSLAEGDKLVMQLIAPA